MKSIHAPSQAEITVSKNLLVDWTGIIALTAGFSGFAIFFGTNQLNPGQSLNDLLSYKLTHLANILLLVASIIYLVHSLNSREIIGKWATAITTTAAIIIGVAFFTRWFESYQILEEGHIPLSNLYEVTLFFTLLTVIIYLIMERLYQSKAAGVFIMPIVLSSIGLQLWLESSGHANPNELIPALKSYWMHAHVLANFIGYGAFAIASAVGVMYLIRARAEEKNYLHQSFARHLPDLNIIDDWIYRAIAVGFPVFTLATILGSAWAYYAWGGYWSWDPKETWALIVLLCYAGFLHARYIKGLKGKPMAWWAIIGFLITLICFLGVNLFLSGLHSYGTVN